MVGRLNIRLTGSRRAQRRERPSLRERIQFEAKPRWVGALFWAARMLSVLALFLFGAAGGFILVAYGVALPGFIRLP